MNPNKYEERLNGPWTEGLYILLTVLFILLFGWRYQAAGLDFLAGVFFVLCLVFIFYSLNYLTLVIQITDHFLIFKFGLITWKWPLENLGEVRLDDDLPWHLKYGGAGIHGYRHRQCYRLSFNFLEHPRVVVTLMHKKGPVQAVSFSTRHPEEVLSLLGQLARNQNIHE